MAVGHFPSKLESAGFPLTFSFQWSPC